MVLVLSEFCCHVHFYQSSTLVVIVGGVIYHNGAVYIDNAEMTTGLAMHVTVSLVAMFAVISDMLIMLLYIIFTVND